MPACRRASMIGISRRQRDFTRRTRDNFKSMTRDYNLEYQDNTRKYAYDFDYLLRDYMMQSFLPFLAKGKALELGCYLGEFTNVILRYFSEVTVVEGSDE